MVYIYTKLFRIKLLLLIIFPFLLFGCIKSESKNNQKNNSSLIQIPAGIDHSIFDFLLKKYVNDFGLVDYKSWKKNKSDLVKLNDYLDFFKLESNNAAIEDDLNSALSNLYNALTLNWVLNNFPIKSIKKTKNPWKAKRHLVFGKMVSLNNIEHDILRMKENLGYKAHAILVCAAKSCPPLQNFAYNKDIFNKQIDLAFKRWLSRKDLNDIQVENNLIKISKIFDWYAEDFKGGNNIKNIFIRYSDEKYKSFLSKDNFKIKYLKYNWELNSQ